MRTLATWLLDLWIYIVFGRDADDQEDDWLEGSDPAGVDYPAIDYDDTEA